MTLLKKFLGAALAFGLAMTFASCNNNQTTSKDVVSTTTEVQKPTGNTISPVEKIEIVADEVEFEKFSQEVVLSDIDFSGIMELPINQYYDIAITLYAENSQQNTLVIDGVSMGEFQINKSEDYQKLLFESLYLTGGEHSISLGSVDGGLTVESIEITSSDELLKISTELDRPVLSYKASSENASRLYDFICEIYGEKILSGQYVSSSENAEISAIYNETKQHPAVRFSDIMYLTQEEFDEENLSDDISSAIQWAENGGIVGFSWHWYAPMSAESFYAEQTDFDLSKAVTKLDLTKLEPKRISQLCEEGLISEECLRLVEDMDRVAEHLKVLKKSDIPVLFRPLPEGGGEWFWWGCDKTSYKWLWELLYNRFTAYHGLDNLIWVWNGQSEDWYVGDKLCDIISVDIYSSTFDSTYANIFKSFSKISTQKPVAISECDKLPDIYTTARDKSFWSYFSLWCGDYLVDENGELNEKYISNEKLWLLYNNSIVITREDLGEMLYKN